MRNRECDAVLQQYREKLLSISRLSRVPQNFHLNAMCPNNLDWRIKFHFGVQVRFLSCRVDEINDQIFNEDLMSGVRSSFVSAKVNSD